MRCIRNSLVPALFLTATLFPIQTPAQEEPPQCLDLLGRVQAEGGGYRGGELFCSGEQINPNSAVEFLCFSNGSIISIAEPTVLSASVCEDDGNRSNQRTCDRRGFGRFGCFITKTPEENDFQVLRPDLISGPRPDIEWEAVPEAQSYRVQIAQTDVIWSRTVANDTTVLLYPQDEPSLLTGEAYDVTITANVDGRIAALASKPINVNQTAVSRIGLQLAATNEAQ